METAQKLFNEKELLTKEEYEFLIEQMPSAKEYMFHNFWNNTYLNLNVYSEVEKEEFDLRREMGF
jgi:hypothetical protein